MTVPGETVDGSWSNSREPGEAIIYRLDKDEFSNGMAMIRNNLIKLMEKDLFGVQALRRLIVEGAAPTFNAVPSNYKLEGSASQAKLNPDQTAAIEKVMSAKDYALVLGMPGTGKTTTIAYIIRALVAQGKSVLLTSYTHNAVDNILLKLRKDNIGIFRVGAIAKIHPEVPEFADISQQANEERGRHQEMLLSAGGRHNLSWNQSSHLQPANIRLLHCRRSLSDHSSGVAWAPSECLEHSFL